MATVRADGWCRTVCITVALQYETATLWLQNTCHQQVSWAKMPKNDGIDICVCAINYILAAIIYWFVRKISEVMTQDKNKDGQI